MNRATWKWWYRQQRIIHRECNKAMTDMLLFGTGFIHVSIDIPDYIKHVPIEQVFTDV